MTHPYATQAYALAFGGNYAPVEMKQAGTFVLSRPMAGSQLRDAMGCYPLTPFAPQVELADDFAALRVQGLVSLVLVTDPFFHPPEEKLRALFDHVLSYKEHYLHDFHKPRDYSKHHRYKVRHAVQSVETRIIKLEHYLDAWCVLYQDLIAKRGITGIQTFSKEYFTALCTLNPVMIGGFMGDELICAHLCLEFQGYVYSHLMASSEEGYRHRATYAVYDHTLRHFAEAGAKIFDLGGGAGVNSASQGLTFFKQGFSNASTTCYLCGKILNAEVYAQLSAGKSDGFFPAYRQAM